MPNRTDDDVEGNVAGNHREDPLVHIGSQFPGPHRGHDHGLTRADHWVDHMQDAYDTDPFTKQADTSTSSESNLPRWSVAETANVLALDSSVPGMDYGALADTTDDPGWSFVGVKRNETCIANDDWTSKDGMETVNGLGWDSIEIKETESSTSKGNWTSTDGMDKLDGVEALLDPMSCSNEFEARYELAFTTCRIQELFMETPNSRHNCREYEFKSPDTHSEMVVILKAVASTIRRLQQQRACDESLVFFAEDGERETVVQAAEVLTYDIDRLDRLLVSVERPGLRVNWAAETILNSFGFKFAGSGYGSTWDALRLLTFLLPLAVVSFVGSHCSSLGPGERGDCVEAYHFDRSSPSLNSVCLWRRHLECLNGFIGGPIWIFGRRNCLQKASVSISIRQFDNLWGPLYATSSASGDYHGNLVAIQTEGGILFRTSDQIRFRGTITQGETAMHWVRTGTIRKEITSPEHLSGRLIISAKSLERLPEKLEPFSRNTRLLIGAPAAQSTVTKTVADERLVKAGPNLSADTRACSGAVVDRTGSGLKHNTECQLTLDAFGQANAFLIRPAGTYKSYYAPDEMQLNFGGGQYISAGFQRVWRRRPGVNWKTRLLDYCSKPCADANRVRQILQLRIGLEVSACTLNARRITLEEALKLAYPAELQAVEQACSSGDPMAVSKFLGNLEFTGITHEDNTFIYWPLSNSIGEVVQLTNPPSWHVMLKDTPLSACFAVMSPRCLRCLASGVGHHIAVGSPCKAPKGGLTTPSICFPFRRVLQTTVELNPEGKLNPPLKVDTDVKLTVGEQQIGQLHIHTESTPYQLAVFKRHNVFGKLKNRLEKAHREWLTPSRSAAHTVPVCILEP
ncbi:hypothetical protein LTR37_002211 [Vermiconidia calcicola]|uniref:Uncharacterized protein n=1 Tax=Vermiconidia calcicola TaxID=1690605 RepID=A0ACC3NTD1_9PEZI|nr:hypothetical protein LTR37_002211 [Vermiconidia calcicola]